MNNYFPTAAVSTKGAIINSVLVLLEYIIMNWHVVLLDAVWTCVPKEFTVYKRWQTVSGWEGCSMTEKVFVWEP